MVYEQGNAHLVNTWNAACRDLRLHQARVVGIMVAVERLSRIHSLPPDLTSEEPAPGEDAPGQQPRPPAAGYDVSVRMLNSRLRRR